MEEITWSCLNCETRNVYEPGRRGQVIALECVKCGAPASIDRKPTVDQQVCLSTNSTLITPLNWRPLNWRI